MPRAKGYVSNMKAYLDEFEMASYGARNNPITKPQPGILPSVMKAAKAGRGGKVTLQEPAIPGTPSKKKSRKAAK